MRYKRFIKQNIGNIISKTYGSLLFKNQKGLKVLMYHDIGNTDSFDLYKIKLQIFKKHLDFIIKGEEKRKIINISRGIETFSNIIITFDDAYSSIYNSIFPLLIEKKIYFTIFVICKYLENKSNKYITINQLKEMSQSKFITIGSHTYNHLQLNKCSIDTAKYEINYSKKYLEDIIGKSVNYLSYPYGNYSEDIKKLVIKSGYKAAFSSKFGFYNNLKDMYNIPRIDIWSTDNINSLNDKIEGKWNWYS